MLLADDDDDDGREVLVWVGWKAKEREKEKEISASQASRTKADSLGRMRTKAKLLQCSVCDALAQFISVLFCSLSCEFSQLDSCGCGSDTADDDDDVDGTSNRSGGSGNAEH